MKAPAWFFLTVLFVACQGRSPFAAYLGTWALKVQDQSILILTLSLQDGKIGGTMRHLENLQFDGEGNFESIGGAPITDSVSEAALLTGELRLTTSNHSEVVMKLVDPDHAEVRYNAPDWMAPWKFERTSGNLALATELPKPTAATPEIAALQATLKSMADEDQAVRKETLPSERRILAVDQKHLPEILRIHTQYGWPRKSVVGREAANQFWLLVQHQTPETQRRLLPDMERLVAQGEASAKDFAFLSDRVLKGQGKLQRYGTQSSCEKGKLLLDPVEDPSGLAQRRRELHMEPVEDNLRLGESWCQNLVNDLPGAK